MSWAARKAWVHDLTAAKANRPLRLSLTLFLTLRKPVVAITAFFKHHKVVNPCCKSHVAQKARNIHMEVNRLWCELGRIHGFHSQRKAQVRDLIMAKANWPPRLSLTFFALTLRKPGARVRM